MSASLAIASASCTSERATRSEPPTSETARSASRRCSPTRLGRRAGDVPAEAARLALLVGEDAGERGDDLDVRARLLAERPLAAARGLLGAEDVEPPLQEAPRVGEVDLLLVGVGPPNPQLLEVEALDALDERGASTRSIRRRPPARNSVTAADYSVRCRCVVTSSHCASGSPRARTARCVRRRRPGRATAGRRAGRR